jgi:sugar/nucleoside kinase (ribokinase family)
MLEARRVYRSPSDSPDGSAVAPGGCAVDLVVVGAASRDMTPDDPRGWRLGGAVTYCSLTAARLGLRVGCLVGVDGPAAPADELTSLEEAGADVRRVALDHGPVFENIEKDGHRRQRWLSRSDLVPAEALPTEWLAAPAWLVVPVAGEAGDDWAQVPSAGATVGTGWQGMLREFSDDGWVRRIAPGRRPLLGRAGLVCASVDDFEPGQRLAVLRELAPGAVIALTAGESGGVALRDGGATSYSAVAAPGVVDATGAGDVFLAALMVAWSLTGEMATDRTLRFAAAAASCSVEGPGLRGVPTRAQVAARLR